MPNVKVQGSKETQKAKMTKISALSYLSFDLNFEI